jgi:uncharacterized protein (DUF1697 family)
MPTHVALLRGVNVGGKTLAMADLRRVMEAAGFADVATYIQSGNVVFTARHSPRLARRVEQAIEAGLGMHVGVAVLSRDELADVVAGNPFGAQPNPRLVHVMFLLGASPAGLASGLAQLEYRGRDEYRLRGRVLYLHTPDGYGRSQLVAALGRGPVGRLLRQLGTARNWGTVTKLLSLLDAGA